MEPLHGLTFPSFRSQDNTTTWFIFVSAAEAVEKLDHRRSLAKLMLGGGNVSCTASRGACRSGIEEIIQMRARGSYNALSHVGHFGCCNVNLRR